MVAGLGQPDRPNRSAGQEALVDFRRQTYQRMAKVDDRLQRWAKQIVLTIVERLAHGFLRRRIFRQRNHKPPKSGIQKRKEIEIHPRLSCKIEYSFRSNHSDVSIASEYFTDDHVR